ncbi:MAG TPA: hypothetical protein VHQ47_13330 [Phycisphaerae bacterium]|nr:hypothetical protein [Phycisphaerae bacterium]
MRDRFEFRRNFDRIPAEVIESLCHQRILAPKVFPHVMLRVRPSLQLLPLAIYPEVKIVADVSPMISGRCVRFFDLESTVVKIPFQRELFLNPHCVYQFAVRRLPGRPNSHDPIASLGNSPDGRLADCQRAIAPEWIRCRAVIND